MLLAYGKNIICKAIYEERKGGLILTSNENKSIHYEVVSVGQDVKFLELGHKVIIRNHMFQEMKYKDASYIIMDESAILAIIME